MRAGDFELCIVNGLELRGSSEVQLRHGQTYQLALTNHGALRCDVFLEIDGKDMGAWRIPAAETIFLERPLRQEGRFTFFRLDSPEAKATGIPKEGTAGKVSAWFLPELIELEIPFNDRDLASLAAAKPEPIEDDEGKDSPSVLFAAKPTAAPREGRVGGTGLTGKSEQQFGAVAEPIDYDDDASKVVEVWLTEEPLYAVFACPDCQQRSRVPAGRGRVRIKCPYCTCQFVRQA